MPGLLADDNEIPTPAVNLIPVDHDPFAAAPVDISGTPPTADQIKNANYGGSLHIILHPGHRPNDVKLFGGMLADADTPEPSIPKTIVDQLLQGGTGNFADEITDPLGAVASSLVSDPKSLITGETTDPALAEALTTAKGDTQKDLSTEVKNHPAISLLSNIAGSILPIAAGGAGVKAIGAGLAKFGITTPAQLATFAAEHPKIAKYLVTSLIGGSGGSIYAAGSGSGGVADRLDNAGSAFLPSAGVGLAGGLLAEKAGSLLGNIGEYFGAGSGATEDAAATAGGGAAPPAGSPAPPPPDVPGGLLGDQITPEQMAQLQQGKFLPLTAGDRTQNTVLQRAERTAEEAGSQPILDARAIQRAAALKPFAGLLGDQQVIQPADLSLRAQHEAGNVADILRGNYDQMGTAVNQAYKAADEVGGAQIPIGAVAESDAGASLMDRLYTTLAAEGVTEKQMPDLYDAVGGLQKIVEDVKANGQTVTTVREMEDWKKNFFNRIDPLKQGIKPGEAKRILTMVNQEYEKFLDDTVQSGIVSGDPEAISAFRGARGLAKERFKFYESEAGLQKILDDRDMTGTDLVNLVLGTGKETGRGKVGNRAEIALDLAGDRAPEMRAAMQQGAFAKILQASIFPTVDAENPSVNAINFAGMHKALNGLIANKEFFNAVFDESEQTLIKTMNEDLRMIGSAQKGVINGSGTGSRVADILKGIGNVINNPVFKHIPVGGTATSLLQKGLTMQGEAIVTGKAEKGLSEFALKTSRAFNAPAAWYGSAAVSAAYNSRALDNEEGDQ